MMDELDLKRIKREYRVLLRGKSVVLAEWLIDQHEEMVVTIDSLLKIARESQKLQTIINQAKAHNGCVLKASDLPIRELELALSILPPVEDKEPGK